MRAKLLIGIILCSSCFVSAQGWKRQYYLQNTTSSVTRDAIETPNGDFITIGRTTDTIMGKVMTRLTLVGSNAQGNYQWRKSYGDSGFWYVNSTAAFRGPVITYSNCFYHSSIVLDSQGKYYSALLKFDYNGDTLWQKFYYSTTYSYTPGVNLYIAGLCKSIDGGILMTGSYEDFNLHQRVCVIIKLDINGIEKWRKTFTNSVTKVMNGMNLLQVDASKKIIVCGYEYLEKNGVTGNYGNVLILDSLGNKLAHEIYNNHGAGGFSDIVQLKNNTFLVSGNYNMNSDVGGFSRDKSYVANFDINGFLIWSRTYDTLSRYTGIGSMNVMKDGNILLAGQIDTAFFLYKNTLGASKLRLHCIDENGNIKWKRFIGLAALLPPDTSLSTNYHNAYNLKKSEYLMSMRQTADNGYIVAAHLPNGNLYGSSIPYTLVKIDSLGCDTTEEYCRANTFYTSVNEMIEKNDGLSIYPNPAGNQFALALDNSNQQRFTLRMYNHLGQLVKEEELVFTDNKANVQTNQLESGIYFICLINNNQMMGSQKIIISR